MENKRVDITSGVFFQIGGEAGRRPGLAWHILEKLADSIQDIIELLAKYDLKTEFTPQLKNFEIEIIALHHGSHVPAFRLQDPPMQSLQETAIRKEVADKFDQLMQIAGTGNYEAVLDIYQLNDLRYEIASELYDFSLAADRSPITIVEPDNTLMNRPWKPIYEIRKFKPEQVDRLVKLPRRIRKQAVVETQEVFGKILLPLARKSGKRAKIVEVYRNPDASVSLTLPQIILPEYTYYLHAPLSCTVKQEEDYYIVEAPLYDLYASGITLDEAEIDFNVEFDVTYRRLNELPDDQLSERLLRAKQAINLIVKEVVTE